MNLPYRIVNEHAWIFPEDRVGTPSVSANLHIARAGTVLTQVLTDYELCGTVSARFRVDGANGVTVLPFRMEIAHIDKNSAPRGLPNVTDDYDEVKSFVTHRAPFDVYDVLVPTGGELGAGKVVLAFEFFAAANAPVGIQHITLTLETDDFTLSVPVLLNIHRASIPTPSAEGLSVCNWIKCRALSSSHGVELYSDEYYALLRKYMKHMLSIRSTVFTMIDREHGACVTPIRDESGKIVDFDLTETEKHLKLAREMGFPIIAGPFVAQWHEWTDHGIWLLWDTDTEVTTPEAYRQLRLYFLRVREMIERNHWENCYWQTLVDEPQENSELMYRAVACICRRFLPNIPISDPIETTNVGGAPDIWCIKQATFEKYLDTYRDYQAIGERMTYYTCGFPAGDTMNRVLDLPLSAGRLTFWMCHRYHLEGFLHWGYHSNVDREHMNFMNMPAGNQGIVYPTKDDLYESLRSYHQLAGAEDWELLNIVKNHDPAKADEIVALCARSFNDYERDPEKLEAVHTLLLEVADRYCE